MDTFLFSPPKDISPITSRRIHIRRLYDVLHLSIQRGDLHRARRTWAILARCKEIDWKTSWLLAVGLLDHSPHRIESNQTKIDYLRTMMLHHPEDRERILCELVHLYVLAGRHREALDELELLSPPNPPLRVIANQFDASSLPSFPFRDNAVLHIYAGMCSVLTSQPGSASEDDADAQPIDNEMLARAQIFFERAKSIDPENIVVDTLLSMTQNLAQNPNASAQTEASDDEDGLNIVTTESARVKRPRTSDWL